MTLRIPIENIEGGLQELLEINQPTIKGKLVEQYMKRLVKDFDRIAALHITEREYEGFLTFKAEYDGETTIKLIPSNVELFKKLEMGMFDADGVMVKPPHSVISEWKVQVVL